MPTAKYSSSDISESQIRQTMPDILDILLICRSTSTSKKNHNIIWANHNYAHLGNGYAATDPIIPALITEEQGKLIMPRALKTTELQKARTKFKAEVFTPSHIVKLQNDALDENYRHDKLPRYLNRKWLEITCGEAPYMANRYEMESGMLIPLQQRTGFVDRKLKRLGDEVYEIEAWHNFAKLAFQSAYGFEWNGDSLLLARENLLYTYWDYFRYQFGEDPSHAQLREIAEIISYNLFQMDGLHYVVPFSATPPVQMTLTDLFGEKRTISLKAGKTGKPAKVMNWKTGKMQFFTKVMKP